LLKNVAKISVVKVGVNNRNEQYIYNKRIALILKQSSVIFNRGLLRSRNVWVRDNIFLAVI